MAAFYCTQLDGDFGEVCRRCPSIAIVFLHVHSFYSMREEGEREGEDDGGKRKRKRGIQISTPVFSQIAIKCKDLYSCIRYCPYSR